MTPDVPFTEAFSPLGYRLIYTKYGEVFRCEQQSGYIAGITRLSRTRSMFLIGRAFTHLAPKLRDFGGWVGLHKGRKGGEGRRSQGYEAYEAYEAYEVRHTRTREDLEALHGVLQGSPKESVLLLM